jgi:hypothetical protein
MTATSVGLAGNVGPLTSAFREAMQRDIEDLTAEKLVRVPYPDGV